MQTPTPKLMHSLHYIWLINSEIISIKKKTGLSKFCKHNFCIQFQCNQKQHRHVVILYYAFLCGHFLNYLAKMYLHVGTYRAAAYPSKWLIFWTFLNTPSRNQCDKRNFRISFFFAYQLTRWRCWESNGKHI